MVAAAVVQPRTRTLTALISAAAGVPLAFAFQRHEFPGKALVRAITLGPLILPSLVTGIALLQFLSLIGLGRWIGFWALLIGHVVICLPFCVRTVAISLAAMPANLEAAASSLGATPFAVLRHVIMPLAITGRVRRHDLRLRPRFDDVNLSLFLARPGERPMTVAILGVARIRLRADARRGLDPVDADPAGAGRAVRPLRRHRRFPLSGNRPWLSRRCSLRALTKRFGALTAVDAIDLAVAPASSSRCSARPAAARPRR